LKSNSRIAAIHRLIAAFGCASGLLSIPLMYFHLKVRHPHYIDFDRV
jgi:hypothetical protein